MRVLSMVLMMTRRHGMQSQLRAGSQRFVPGNLSADCPFLFDCIKLATGPVIYYIPENVSNPRTVKRLWPWFHLAIVAQGHVFQFAARFFCDAGFLSHPDSVLCATQTASPCAISDALSERIAQSGFRHER